MRHRHTQLIYPVNTSASRCCRFDEQYKQHGFVWQDGFTLIEALITVVILSVVAAIAIPSYRQFVIINAERDTQAKMLQLEMELKKWRASALSYRGFFPTNTGCAAGASRCYDAVPMSVITSAVNTTIYQPSGSDASNYRYVIVITGADNDAGTPDNQSLVPTATSTSASAELSVGRAWKMVAIPNPNLAGGGRIARMYRDSQHVECRTYSELTLATLQDNHNCIGNDYESW